MTPLYFHSHHPLSCKEVIIYSQALQYNMIISEDHILQEELNNLTRIILACKDLLHSIIKNEKSLDRYHNNLLSQRTPQTLTKVLPIITPFSDIGKLFTATIHRIDKQLPLTPHSPLFGHPNPYQPTPNSATFTAMSILKKDNGSSRQDSWHYYPYTPT